MELGKVMETLGHNNPNCSVLLGLRLLSLTSLKLIPELRDAWACL